MHQRQYRPGDVLDDYCPRERRITDHAVVAMVEGEIQRTRCVVCEAEHEFKNARLPAQRKKGGTATLFTQVLDSLETPSGRAPVAGSATEPDESGAEPPAMAASSSPPAEAPPSGPAHDAADDRPFRRSLIRAQLPRPEGQPPPTRAIPEFTMHQPLNQRSKRPGDGRFRRRPGAGQDQAGPMRFGREQGNSNGGGQGGRRRRRKKH
ncbi:MAG: hypothetical protein OEW19_12570 [Acidobacteriota bacterium]|nr:hypothetical protein [Acidobacteriota bacterium]